MNYVVRTKLRRECSRLIRAFTHAQDCDKGRSAYKVPTAIAKRIESIVGADFSEVMQDAGYYRPPGKRQWATGGRTRHGGEPVTYLRLNSRFWTLLSAIVTTYGASNSDMVPA